MTVLPSLHRTWSDTPKKGCNDQMNMTLVHDDFKIFAYKLTLASCLKANMSRVVRKRIFAYAKTKTQISFAVTAKLISAFVFAIRLVQFLFKLNTKFQASSHLLSLCSLVCVGPGRKPRRPVFSERGSYNLDSLEPNFIK